MVEIICEKTGVAFESATKRTRNHPEIMRLVNEANKNGWYGECLAAIESGRQAGYTTIEQFVDACRAAEAKKKSVISSEIHAETERKFAARDARRQRFATNNFLRDHGYSWSNVGDEDDSEFLLFASDGRSVSVKQAMQELALQQNTYATEWLNERGLSLQKEKKLADRPVVEEGVYQSSSPMGQLVVITDGPRKNPRILMCLSCTFVSGDHEQHIDSGYACTFAAPTEKEMQSKTYQRMKKRLDEEAAYDRKQEAQFEERRNEALDAIRATGREPDLLEEFFAGTSE